MTSQATAVVRIACASAEHASRLRDALAPENEHYLSARVEGSDLVLEASAGSALSLLHTLDDALACLSAAEKASRLGAE